MTAPLSRDAWLAGHGAGLHGERPLPTILELMDSQPQYQGPGWTAWRAFLAAAFCLPMDKAMLETFRACTGREEPPTAVHEVVGIVGRRGGKDKIATLASGYVAAYRRHDHLLAPGQWASIPIIAASQKQAIETMNYLRGLFSREPLSWLLDGDPTATEIRLLTRVRIEVQAASFRTVRATTTPMCVMNEVAFWHSDDSSKNPDEEILRALRPSMATIPGAMLWMISSPYARRGVLWEAYDKYYGRDGSVLVWKAPTLTMHPSPSVAIYIEMQYKDDPVSASAEYGAEFRGDVVKALPLEAIDKSIDKGVLERSPEWHLYYGFVDPAGGGPDSFTVAIAHAERRPLGEGNPLCDSPLARGDGQLILDAVREWRGESATTIESTVECCALLKEYRITMVWGDHFAGNWPRDQFAARGITYVAAPEGEKKSDLYHRAVPAFLRGRVRLIDNERLRSQLILLDRKTTGGGRDVYDHPKGEHDDLANAVCGALFYADKLGTKQAIGPEPLPPPKTIQEMQSQQRVKDAAKREADYCKRLRGGGWTGAWGRVAMYRRAKR